jgi:DNA modification methylase
MADDVCVIHGDCLQRMREMPDGSIDAILADPPYCSGAQLEAQRNTPAQGLRSAKWLDPAGGLAGRLRRDRDRARRSVCGCRPGTPQGCRDPAILGALTLP